MSSTYREIVRAKIEKAREEALALRDRLASLDEAARLAPVEEDDATLVGIAHTAAEVTVALQAAGRALER